MTAVRAQAGRLLARSTAGARVTFVTAAAARCVMARAGKLRVVHAGVTVLRRRRQRSAGSVVSYRVTSDGQKLLGTREDSAV